jgi:hypothetical protein
VAARDLSAAAVAVVQSGRAALGNVLASRRVSVGEQAPRAVAPRSRAGASTRARISAQLDDEQLSATTSWAGFRVLARTKVCVVGIRWPPIRGRYRKGRASTLRSSAAPRRSLPRASVCRYLGRHCWHPPTANKTPLARWTTNRSHRVGPLAYPIRDCRSNASTEEQVPRHGDHQHPVFATSRTLTPRPTIERPH